MKDPHTETAAKLFGVKPEDVTPEQRAQGKRVNYHRIYSSNDDWTVEGPEIHQGKLAAAGLLLIIVLLLVAAVTS